MAFIDRHWSAGHILARDRALMDFQHGDPDDRDHYNWLIAEDNGEMVGILGYIPTRIYDAALDGQCFVWLTLWCVRPDMRGSAVGLRLLRAFEKVEPNSGVGVLGVNPEHPPMYRALGYRVGELAHHVLFSNIMTTKLANRPEGWIAPKMSKGSARLDKVTASRLPEIVADERAVPYKTAAYFSNRYLGHPIYRYDVFAVVISGKPRALLAARVAEHDGARALRIVDYAGPSEVLAACGPALLDLIVERGAEYADLWEYGLEPDDLADCGFARVAADGDLIVPNYFEPFVRQNQRIEFAIRAPERLPVRIFRGDGDQDRPSTMVRQ